MGLPPSLFPNRESDRGDADLALIVRPDRRRFQALDLLLEFRYPGLKALGLSGEQAWAQSRESLLSLPSVAAMRDEAAAQAATAGVSLRQGHGLADLHVFAVVAPGVEGPVWRVIPTACFGQAQ